MIPRAVRSLSSRLHRRVSRRPVGPGVSGRSGAPRARISRTKRLEPALGFAWDIFGNGKTSLRGGTGVFYDILKGEDNLQFNGQAPFFGFADIFPTTYTGTYSSKFA